LVFGALASVTALIPLVGTPVVWVPAGAVLFLQRRWIAALFLVGWGVVVVSSADNVLRPLFISGRAPISTLPVFLGVLGGVSAFGPIGLVAGPVLVSLTLVLVRLGGEAGAGGPARRGSGRGRCWCPCPSCWSVGQGRRGRKPSASRPGTPAGGCAGSACLAARPAARRPSRKRCKPSSPE